MRTQKCFWCKSNNLKRKSQRKDGKSIVECKECGLFMVGEIPENLDELYKKDYFEKNQGDSLVGYKNYFSSPVTNVLGKYAFSKLFLSEKFKKYLDLGCADGSLLEIFKEYGYNVYGLDISEEAINEARKRKLWTDVSDLKRLPFKEEEFDFISAFDLIEHLDDPSETLKEVQRVLKKEGIFFYSTLCITKATEDEFWFNNSLEHLIYYDKAVFSSLIEKIFGKNNVENIVVEINGVSEIIGIAKNEEITERERNILQSIKSGEVIKTKDDNYYLSLFYNQLGRFEESEMAINAGSFAKGSEEYVFLKFINLFYQGKFFEAVDLVKSFNAKISLSNAIFWQTYSFIEKTISELEKKNLAEKDKEIAKNRDLLAEKDKEIARKSEIIKKNRDLLAEKDKEIARKEAAISEQNKILDERLAFINNINQSKIILPILIVRNKLKKIKRNFKSDLINLEDSIVYFGREYLNENIKKYLRPLLNEKYQIKKRLISNECPLVSVIIPCYNYGKFIVEAISSVLASTYQNIEIIVIDDGPTDEYTIELLKNLKMPKTKILFQENQGLARARNNGIREANGKYILPLDADDKIEATYIEKGIYILEKNPEFAFVYGFAKVFGAQNFVWETGKFEIEGLRRENIIPSCTLFRKSAWEMSGGYENDRHQYDDWTFWLKLSEFAFWGKQIPEVLFYHRKHESVDSMSDKLAKRHREYYVKMQKVISEINEKKKKEIGEFLKKKKIKEPSVYLNANECRIKISQKRKILIFLPWLSTGGVERVMLNLLKKLSGWEFFIVTTQSDNYDPEIDISFKKITPFVYHLPAFLDWEDWIDFICDLIRNYKIDTILINHCEWAYENIKYIKGASKDIKIFDLLHNTANEGFKNHSKKYNYEINKTIVISEEIKNHLLCELNYSDTKLECVLNGIDTDNVFNPINYNSSEARKEFNIPENKLVITYIGRLSEEKNPLKFIEVTKKLVGNGSKNYFFIMAGDGNLKESVLKEINNNFFHEEFLFLGNCMFPEKVLSSSDMLLNTSSIEGMPLTLMEALSMEVPVIAPDIGGIKEIIKNEFNGILLSSNPDVVEYINAIKKLQIKKEYLRIKSNTRNSVKNKFSMKSMATTYKKIFETS